MTVIIVGLYDSADKAQQAIAELDKAGFDKNSVEMLGRDGHTGTVADRLTGHGIEADDARLYAEAIERGGSFVIFEAPDEKAENAVSILDRHGAQNLNDLAAELGKDAQQEEGHEHETVPVVEEQVSIGKRPVLRGGVRVTSIVTERPVEETISLREEKVDVERQPVERKLSPEEAEKAFEQKTVELTETGEEAVIIKEARVVEEVSLRKSAEEHEEKIQTTVRRTDVKVEDVEPQQRSRGQDQDKQIHSAGGGDR